MIPPVSAISTSDLNGKQNVSSVAADQDAMKQAAIDFEATYIAQMLTFSGLDKALLTGGGDDMSAFTSFYIQSFADDIAENGGFGLAEVFYKQMVEMSSETSSQDSGEQNVDFGKL